MGKVRLRFFGAAREVTGSMHLVEVDGRTIALDCGLFQGKRSEAELKNRELPGDAKAIDAVILSHAHLDHCGKLPRLVREGFVGPIYCTPATRDLAEIVMSDSAHIQEEDAEYWNKKRLKRGDQPIVPLYTQEHVDATVPLMRPMGLNEQFDVIPGVQARFHEAGHMLGSAGIHVIASGARGPVRITFTGDLGRPNTPILNDPAPLPECDHLICESTYGGRETPTPQGLREQFADIINAAIDRGGKVIVPSFAIGRTQVLVYYFNQLVHEGKIKQRIPLVVDSPMASKATEVFRRHPEIFDEEATTYKKGGNHMFRGDWSEFTTSVEDSKALHRRPGPMIIVSASGMCEAGRILHHLKNNVSDPKNTVLIVGYQAADTLGRRLVERQPEVRIFGETYPVRAEIKVLNGFSAHANSAELLRWTSPLAKRAKAAYLVHGEPDQAETLAKSMRAAGFPQVHVPSRGYVFDLDE
jgi:metallo-beta-lactamase family protein